MKKFFVFLNAIIGYAGSSEDPGRFSLRLTGIVTAGLSQLLPIILPLVLSLGMSLPSNVSATELVNTYTPLIQIVFLTIGLAIWLVGAFRAGWQAVNATGAIQRMLYSK